MGAGTTSSQEGSFGMTYGTNAAKKVDFAGAQGTAAEDSTGALNLVISWQWGATVGTITMSHYIVEKIA